MLPEKCLSHLREMNTSKSAVNCFCRLKVLTKMPSVDDDQLKAVLSELLRHADLSIEIGLSACRQLNGTGR